MSLKIGDKAPLFTLKDTDKNDVSLADFHGQNVVVLFFPLAFSSVCTTELCEIRDTRAQYDQLDAQILAISVDSLFTLKKFKEIENYNFTLLSDWNKTTAAAYGALYDEFVFGMKGVAKRSAFVIDKTGNIQYAEVLENAGDLPNFEAINETLHQLS
ncbi:MAG: redoxin domain-containing protein [Saprospiraceae bacterium]|nr:MAG: alkyl hydroperoxide reductase [Bacteroidetes bacterium OLB9]MCO6464499.1 redoxin domain-containing protein [Saprospiraceae bacterium]MCZ2340110.1 redoxin domain-containing protein [Chitinophagales bacterium]